MPPRSKPACVTAAPEDAVIIAAVLDGREDDKKADARKAASTITVLWQHWSPRLKSAIRADVAQLVPVGNEPAAAIAGGYSERLARQALRDMGRG